MPRQALLQLRSLTLFSIKSPPPCSNDLSDTRMRHELASYPPLIRPHSSQLSSSGSIDLTRRFDLPKSNIDNLLTQVKRAERNIFIQLRARSFVKARCCHCGSLSNLCSSSENSLITQGLRSRRLQWLGHCQSTSKDAL